MFKNHLKIAFRNLLRQKIYSFINIAGLAIGLAASFIILLYVAYENSFDKFHENYGRIYRITAKDLAANWTEAKVPFSLATEMKASFPEVETIARMTAVAAKVRTNAEWQRVRGFRTADPALHKILTLPLVSGDWQAIVDNPNAVVITEAMAERFFPVRTGSPLGETLELDCFGDRYQLQVVGVMKNLPRNSTFKTNFIAPLAIGEKYWNKQRSGWAKKTLAEDWRFNMFVTYLLLPDHSLAKQIESKLPALVQKHQSEQAVKFGLQPIADFYFHSSDFVNYRSATGDLANVYIYTAVAFLILLIAIINYVILSTARSITRSKEVGVRKVLGANRSDLIRQMLVESLLLPLLALPLAIILVESFLPSFSVLLGKRLESAYYQSWPFILGFVGITVLVGAVSGSYISFYLSTFNPIETLKDKLSASTVKPALRKVLVSVQMAIFVGMLVASVIIYQQLRYFYNKDFGFNKEHVISLDVYKSLGNNYEAFKNALKNLPGVVNVSAAYRLPPTGGRGVWQVPSPTNPEKKILVEGLSVDFDFIETLEFEVLQGRAFAKDFPSDKTDACVVNETLIRELGIVEPLGKKLSLDSGQQIIGVVKDFHMHSLREKIMPLAMSITDKYLYEIAIRVRPGDILNTIAAIKDTWAEFVPDQPAEVAFFDSRVDALYQAELKFARTIRYFTFLAIFIACLGLSGLTLFISVQRTKEIGIRKVLGASIPSIVSLLSKEFLMLIVAANLIAWPVAYQLIDLWLQNFAYRISPGIFTFAVAGMISLLIIFLTISTQAIRAALANPVESLRYE